MCRTNNNLGALSPFEQLKESKHHGHSLLQMEIICCGKTKHAEKMLVRRWEKSDPINSQSWTFGRCISSQWQYYCSISLLWDHLERKVNIYRLHLSICRYWTLMQSVTSFSKEKYVIDVIANNEIGKLEIDIKFKKR